MLSSILPKLKTQQEDGTHGVYIIEPLERSYGITVGNALRRALLSALPGVAVTMIRVEGVSHEFSTISGVKEDVLDIVLNIKQLRLQKLEDFEESVTLELRAKGEGVVKAKDIVCPPQIKIVNPDLHVCTITGPKTKLSLELTVEEGRGYVPAAERVFTKRKPVDVIPIDALFTPIRQVNFKVEPTRVGQRSDYDKLILTIETDGSLTPLKAINLSGGILVEHFHLVTDERLFKPLLQEPETEQQMVVDGTQAPAPPADLTIEDLGLSTRVLNSLHAAKIDTVSQLLDWTEEDLLKLKNFGQKSLSEINSRLKEYNLALPHGQEEEA
jgi:DNA-directed RNA polymerase subunit alpha